MSHTFTHSLFERLNTWCELFLSRPDVRVTSALRIRRDVTSASFEYPPDAAAFAREATSVSFCYEVHNPATSGGLALRLEGARDDVFLALDGQPKQHSLVLLEADTQGTGHAGWYALSNDEPPFIVWDVEAMCRFRGVTDYLTEGAKRAFGASPAWQHRRRSSALLERSIAERPLGELEEALKKRGAPSSMATDLVNWLGTAARLLVPA